MCLIIDKHYHKGVNKKYRIAIKPILCYKVVYFDVANDIFITPHQHIKISMKDEYIVADYFQKEAESSKVTIYDYIAGRLKKESIYKITYGIHIYNDLSYAIGCLLRYYQWPNNYKSLNAILLECVVEKGTKYWVGKDHQICAEKVEFGRNIVVWHDKDLCTRFKKNTKRINYGRITKKSPAF